jgi:hypothetical protein
MIYFNIKPLFILDSTKIIDLKLDAVSKRLALKNKQSNHDRSNFNILINEVKLFKINLKDFCFSLKI